MPLTKEEITEIAGVVTDTVKATGLLDPKPKFNPGDEPTDKEKGGKGPLIKDANAPKELAANPTGGFNDLSEFYSAISGKGRKYYGVAHTDKLKRWEEAINKTAGHMEEGDMGQGGYLVPEEFQATLLMTTLENSIVKPRATAIPVSANRVGIPAVVDSDHSSSYFGGINVYRTGEAAQKTAKKPGLGKVNLTLHKLTGLVYVSDELLDDSPISLAPVLNAMFSQSIAFEEDDDYLVGSGAGRPLGAFATANPSLVAQAKETGQAAATIVWQNIAKMWSRVHPSCMRNAVWVANNECFPQLATMTMAVGTGGVPVWLPANGAATTPFGTLMGRPLFLSEKMQALGTQGDIGIADFSQYLIANKAGGGLKTATSIHIKFDYDETAFRWVLRYDGQPWWLSALTPKRGSATLSPFVVLAARA